MVLIKPFKAVYYNPKEIPNFSEVITPPYDVISEDEKQAYLRLNPYNSIRLILPPQDSYETASNFFRNWMASSILIQDQQPAIYVLRQDFKHAGRVYQKSGFMALGKIEPFSDKHIFPHEKTFSAPKEDRLKLLQACRANFDQVFMIYDDRDKKIELILKKVMKFKPWISFKDDKGITNNLWRVSEQSVISKIVRLMKDKKIVIADGHHRYETALNFNPAGFSPFYFASIRDAGLLVLPIHRVIKQLSAEVLGQLETRLKAFFEIKSVNIKGQDKLKCLLGKMEKCKKKHAFGMYHKGNYYLLILKDEKMLKKIIPDRLDRMLDVAIFKALIMETVLQIRPEAISYTNSEAQAQKMVDSDGFSVAFFLNATPVDTILKIAGSGRFMPQKSTYFYPKLPSGLIMRDLTDRNNLLDTVEQVLLQSGEIYIPAKKIWNDFIKCNSSSMTFDDFLAALGSDQRFRVYTTEDPENVLREEMRRLNFELEPLVSLRNKVPTRAEIKKMLITHLDEFLTSLKKIDPATLQDEVKKKLEMLTAKIQKLKDDLSNAFEKLF